ncbi:MAG: hypothetical protein QXJ68_00060 [Methanocellales archaeon]
MNENKSLLQDSSASESLIFRFIIALILFGVLLSIVFTAIRENLLEINEEQILGEIQRIELTALLLYKSGSAREVQGRGIGNLQVLKLQIPESMDYAAFGAAPGGELSFRSEAEVNLYYYKLKNGRMQIFSSNAKFCAAELKNGSAFPLINKPAILRPGSYEIYLELVQIKNETYVMIYGGKAVVE